MQVFSKMRRDNDPSANIYYENFSKFILEEQSAKDVVTSTIVHYSDYKKNPTTCLSKCKLRDLKATAKHLSSKGYRVHVHGNKCELIERIHQHFHKIRMAIKIQSLYRRYLVRVIYGSLPKDVSKCVNDTDFFTMDRMSEIPREHIFYYEDHNGFMYSFDIFSLIQLFKREKKITNPYNREDLPISTVLAIVSIYVKMCILYPDLCSSKSGNTSLDVVSSQVENGQSLGITIQTRQQIVAAKLAEVRSRSINQRITDVFIEIDNLGNYSQSRWFSDLSKLNYARFYESYHRWWNRLSPQTQSDICAIRHPFSNILSRPIDDIEEAELQEICLELIENMVYTGKDLESKTLGALHVLTQLTVVSYWARSALPWLYESIEGVYGRYR